ncbi:hypothetical protein BC936DRAFT_144352 [Jimgerdemannia flammicorona]|uniref:HCP-like protein n=1 Tax=Jimgerdemannia flammicorona TaxID=994334 RepID=A0A432ZYE6_9FUNG|nr:hypothetical protein BC936DRAFT_144352 [Jimgerdemannia flammicorona]
MAMIYFFGDLGQTQNFRQALSLLARAAREANEECPHPSYVLGLILASDYPKIDIPREHVIPDDSEALRNIGRAAELGYTPALNKLGQYYEYGMAGLEPDPWKSLQYYEQAAERGDPEAMLSLSGWYMSGAEGCFEKNEPLAFKWCDKAAKKGMAKAEFALGYYYEVGIGVQSDVHRAIEHYNRAASKGYRNAIERLNRGSSVTRMQHDETIRRVKGARDPFREDKDNKDCVVS